MTGQVGFQPAPRIGDATPGARGSTTSVTANDDPPAKVTWTFEPGCLTVVYHGDNGCAYELDTPAGRSKMDRRQRGIARGVLAHIIECLDTEPGR